MESEHIITINPGNKNGIKIRLDHYNAVKSCVLSTLCESNGLSFNDLLNKVHQKFVQEFKESTGWLFYNVKLDLEARGLITHNRQEKIVSINNTLDTKHSDTPTDNLFNTKKKIVTNPVKEKFLHLFKGEPLIVKSPGRINLLGEHTDYNNGFVMPAAIDKSIQVAVSYSKLKQSMIYSLRYNQFFAIDHSRIERVESPTWANYFLGIIHQLQAQGHTIRPFDCVFDGDLPLGAGLSSSAAVECAFVYALNALFNLKISTTNCIQIAQWAEHNYVGVKCGIMDQFASVMGKENHAMLLDCRDLTYDLFPIKLNNFSLLLCDTGVKHSLATSEYNTRRNECEQGVCILSSKYPLINSLRDVSIEMLLDSKDLFPENVFKRCLYVLEENERVLVGCKDLREGRLKEFGQKMYSTHKGLSSFYDVSCPELDFLVKQASEFEGILGSRMMGAGFGGCTLNIIDSGMTGEFIQRTRSFYKKEFDLEMKSYVVKLGNGTSIVENPFAGKMFSHEI